jgi:integrase
VPRGFTDLAIKNLKPGPVRREIRDPGCDGLYVIVQPTGHKSFAARFRFQGKPKKLSLGTMSLSAARKAATTALHEAKEGRDPTLAKQQAKVEQRTVAATTFRSVAERYMALKAGMRRDGDQVTFGEQIRTAARRQRDLERAILPTLGHRPIVEIKHSEITALLDKIEMESGKVGVPDSGKVAADRALALIRAIMNWYATRADNFVPPIVRGMARTSTEERARSRILTDDEIRAIWNSKESGAFPALVRYLLLTGARRAEAARMTWEEIDGSDWILPASRNKTKKYDLVRPLSAAALAVIEGQRSDCPFIFSKGRKAISTFSRDKVAFDAAIGISNIKKANDLDWRIHDLRRTARSLLSRAGITPDIGERCLGHVISGVRKTYDRHEYYDEKKHAYDALAALIERIARPPGDNVESLHGKKKRA